MQCLFEGLGGAGAVEVIACSISPFIAQKLANIRSGDKKCCSQVRVKLFVTSPQQSFGLAPHSLLHEQESGHFFVYCDGRELEVLLIR